MGLLVLKRRPPPSGAKIFYGQGKPRKHRSTRGSRVSTDNPDEIKDYSESRASTSTAVNTASSHPCATTQPSSQSIANSGGASRRPFAVASASTVLSLLKEVCEVFKEVPYVSLAAGVALQIIRMADEVRSNAVRTKEAIDKVITYSRVVFGALKDSEIRSADKLHDLSDDLVEIGAVLVNIQKILVSLTGKKTSDRLSRLVNRNDVLSCIQEQDRRLDTAVTAFQLKSSIVLRMGSRAPNSGSSQSYLQPTTIGKRVTYKKLPAKPQIMFGRDQEVEQIVKTILEKPPARVAILGTGGIGKTSTALSVLYDKRICDKYADSRLFVSCEAAASVDLILSEIALSMQINTKGLADQLYNKIIQQLGTTPAVLVLDNFETPWHNPDLRRETEVLLEDLTSIDTLAVIVTLRGSEYPAGVRWSQPLLPSLRPVDWASALSIFETISNKMDSFAEKLIRAVDCVPLAVSLLGYLASVDGETPETLWKRWSVEKTAMIERGGEDRLTNLEYSIQLSLSNPRMKENPTALTLLSIFSILPDGVFPATYAAIEKILPDSPSLQKSIATLRQNALIYKDVSDDSIRILNPIRLFVLSHHPPQKVARLQLQEYYIDLALEPSSSRRLPQTEFGNTEAMLIDALRGGNLDHAFDATLSFSQHAYSLGIMSMTAIAMADEQLAASVPIGSISPSPDRQYKKPRAFRSSRIRKWNFWKRNVAESGASSEVDAKLKKRGDCLGCWGQMLSRQGQLKLAEEKLKQALVLHEQAGDIAGQAYDLHNLGCLMSRQPSTIDDAEAKFQNAIQLHEQIGDTIGKIYDLMGLGHVHLQRSKNLEAIAIFERALQYHVEDGDITGQAAALGALGHALLARSMCAAAEERFRRALELYEKAADTAGKAGSLSGIACTYLLRSNYDKAKAAIDASLSLQASPGDPNDLHILGRVYILGSYLDEAETTFMRALELHTQSGDELGQADDWHYLARVYFQQGKMTNAINMLARAQAVFAQSDRSLGTADSFSCAAMIDLRHDQVATAQENIDEAMALYTELDCEIGLAHAWHLQGCIHLRNAKNGWSEEKQDKFQAAADALRKALNIHSRIGNIQGEANDYNVYAEVQMSRIAAGAYLSLSESTDEGTEEHRQEHILRQNAYSKALISVSRALELHLQTGDRAGQGNDLILQAHIFCLQSRCEDAECTSRMALALHTDVKFQYGVGISWYVMALVAHRRHLQEADSVEFNIVRELAEKAQELLVQVGAMYEEECCWQLMCQVGIMRDDDEYW